MYPVHVRCAIHVHGSTCEQLSWSGIGRCCKQPPTESSEGLCNHCVNGHASAYVSSLSQCLCKPQNLWQVTIYITFHCRSNIVHIIRAEPHHPSSSVGGQHCSWVVDTEEQQEYHEFVFVADPISGQNPLVILLLVFGVTNPVRQPLSLPITYFHRMMGGGLPNNGYNQ